ncbi:hypothetical protein I3760_16G078000 [Carya illinoinensis]|nr:hypothetical protein I3760_16G078000 [Carya illinoinensis]
MEMFRLRSRQMEMEKDGKPNLLLNFGSSKRLEEDSESRTIIVTNVHFAATKEALSLYFAKCGSIFNMMILMKQLQDEKGLFMLLSLARSLLTKHWNLELSGSQFFSTAIKVNNVPFVLSRIFLFDH